MAFQTADVVRTMVAASGQPLSELRVDGGASVMDGLLQVQADLAGVPVRRSAVADTTALGAAYLAGRAEGVWTAEDISRLWAADFEALPGDDRDQVATAYEGWRRAVERALAWTQTGPAPPS
jgi:glycerol kinase